MQIGKIPPFLPIERAIMTVSAQNLVWIDMEMTGLDPEENVVLEIATIVTDKDLNVLAEGPVIAIHQSEEELGKMDDWNVNTHTKSGSRRVNTTRPRPLPRPSPLFASGCRSAPAPCAATASARIAASWSST